jgi:phosphoribosyl-ATP pyrophosphohydrolase/phosphoribosyl-AMP cyclohydrolase
MIVPSIDIKDGRAVQLKHGREFVLDGGDPMERLDQFAVVGEVAVVDLDAATGRGDNTDVMLRMVRHAPCRVGGGIRNLDAARMWLDAGAARIVVGTAASTEFCSQLPRERVVAAVDTSEGTVVVDGWRQQTAHEPIHRIAELAPTVGGFLLTQVDREGEMAGFDASLVERAVQAAGDARVTAAGGIATSEQVAALDRLGADAQIGMALYTNQLTLGDAFSVLPVKGVHDRLWPTVVCDTVGATLGLAWSTRESLAAAVNERCGIYWSRSRREIWRKGATSGATQDLLRVDLDCDRDALRFTVRQHGVGFCHTGTRSCWPAPFDFASLERVIAQRRDAPLPGSGTTKLFEQPALLEAKLAEEAVELARAGDTSDIVHELADLLYFAMVSAARGRVTINDALRELERRHLRVTRRPMTPKSRERSQ